MRVFILFFIVVFSFEALCDVYSYRDDRGKLYIVDSINQVPLNYRDRVKVLPSGKRVREAEKRLNELFLFKGSKDAGKIYLSFLLYRIRGSLVLLCVVIVLSLFSIYYFRDYFVFLNAILFNFFLIIFLYFFIFYPEVKKDTESFSYLIKTGCYGYTPVSFKVKIESLEYAISKNPVPLNPYRYFKNVYLLSDAYSNLHCRVKDR